MEQRSEHILTVDGRRELVMTGVAQVIAFDDAFIDLSLGEVSVTVEGEGLEIVVFDAATGRLSAKGFVTAVYYSDRPTAKRHGLFSRRKS